MSFSAQYLLTEVARGLDAINCETTATLLPNGDFDLHSPTEGSAKFVLSIRIQIECSTFRHRMMPPTGPFGGIPRVAIVIARLIVEEQDHGLRPFVVALGDGKQMCKGVTSR